MSMEELWYEASPYFYAVLGTGVLLGSEGTLALSSGALLVVTSAIILWLRFVNRRRPYAPDRRKAARIARAATRTVESPRKPPPRARSTG